MQFVLHGFGVCLGVVAGVLVTLAVQRINEKRYEKQRRSNLKFEFEWMTGKIAGWLEELDKLEKAVSSETLGTYEGYFELSTTSYPTASDMFLTGELYRILEDKQIAKLQEITSGLTVRSENYLNNTIGHYRLAYAKARAGGDSNAAADAKEKTTAEVVFWRKKFQGHSENLNAMIATCKALGVRK